jgi:hypothetical protein
MFKRAEEKPNETVRRSQWMLLMMERAGKKNSNVKHRQFCCASSHFQARVATR